MKTLVQSRQKKYNMGSVIDRFNAKPIRHKGTVYVLFFFLATSKAHPSIE